MTVTEIQIGAYMLVKMAFLLVFCESCSEFILEHGLFELFLLSEVLSTKRANQGEGSASSWSSITSAGILERSFDVLLKSTEFI